MTIFINGRFLTAPQTGVQRTARNLVMGLDAALGEGAADLGEVVLLRPAGAPALPLKTIRDEPLPGKGVLWEQLVLPFAARGPLLNLANSAPVFGACNILMIHDAQVYIAPESYSPLFRGWYRFMQPAVARSALAVLTVSNFSAGELRRHNIFHGAAKVVPNGVDHILSAEAEPDYLRRTRLTPGNYVFAFNSPQPHKNLRVLLAAMAEMTGGPTLALAGPENPGPLPPGTVQLGRISDGRLRTLYENALCLALPSTTEGFGLPAGEAMTCGCPVLAADAGALPEVCGGAAILLPPHDPAAWARAIAELAANPERRNVLAVAGRKRAAQLTWAQATSSLIAALQSVCADEASPESHRSQPAKTIEGAA